MTEHRIWSGAPPWEPSVEIDGTPSILTGCAFYAVSTTWYIVGGSIRVPVAGVGAMPSTVTIEMRVAPTLSLIDLSAPPVKSGVATVAAGWCDARWDSEEVPPGMAAWISLSAGTRYLFVSPASVGTEVIQADDASDLYLAEATQPRSAFRVGSDPTVSSQAWYGLGIIASDQAGGTVWPVSGVATALSGAVGQVAARQAVAGRAAAVSSAFGTVSGGTDPDPLPLNAMLVPTTPRRGLTSTTPRLGLEAA